MSSQTTICYDSTYNAYRPFAIFCVFLYPLGVPALFLAVLSISNARGHLGHEAVKLRIGFLYEAYQASGIWIWIST